MDELYRFVLLRGVSPGGDEKAPLLSIGSDAESKASYKRISGKLYDSPHLTESRELVASLVRNQLTCAEAFKRYQAYVDNMGEGLGAFIADLLGAITLMLRSTDATDPRFPAIVDLATALWLLETLKSDRHWDGAQFTQVLTEARLLLDNEGPAMLAKADVTKPKPHQSLAKKHPNKPVQPEFPFAMGYAAVSPPARRLARPAGLGELLIVRQKHHSYELGEIAHIENVLAKELRRRTHVRSDFSEQMTFLETETVQSQEQDLQSTDRFELATQSQKEAQSSVDITAGANVSGSYGPVTASASFGFAYHGAQSEATSLATRSAKETVQRAAQRTTERTLSRRQSLARHEVSETNLHEVNNESSEHVRGIYRWVNQVSKVGVYSYGARLMVELIVPQPAAFLKWATAQGGTTGPLPSRAVIANGGQLTQPGEITSANYLALAAQVGAAVKAPPPETIVIGSAIAQEYSRNSPGDGDPSYLFYKVDKTIALQSGYEATNAEVTILASTWAGNCYVAIGAAVGTGSNPNGSDAMPARITLSLNKERGSIPMAMVVQSAWGYSLSVTITGTRTEEAFQNWQIETFNAIEQAYQKRLSDWQDAQTAASIGSGIAIDGRNPAANQEIVRAELKRAAIELMAGASLDAFGAIDPWSGSKEPHIDFAQLKKQQDVIGFYEQVFEWEQISYALYPYFWGRHSDWVGALRLPDDSDSTYEAFLNAGAARLIVPVRPAFTNVGQYFITTGRMWNGGNAPAIGDPLYMSLAQELTARLASSNETLVGETWDVTLPTSLVYLQEGADLNPAP